MSALTGERPGAAIVEQIRGARVATWATIGLLIAVLVVNAILQPTFFSQYAIASNASTFLPLILVATAQAIVVIGGGLDLSLGAIVALASVVAVQVMQGDSSRLLLGVLAAVGTGAIAGLANGLVIGLVRLQPLIATFASASVFSGLALWVLPTPGGTVPQELRGLFRQAVAGIPVPVLLIALIVVVWLLVRRFRLFQHIRAVGGSAESAYASLVPAVRTQVLTYVVAGAIAGLAALMVLGNTGSGDPFIGGDLALNSVAAIVVGGVALRGGIGSPIGAMAGAVILALASNVIFYLGLPTQWRPLVSGLVVIGALALSALGDRRRR